MVNLANRFFMSTINSGLIVYKRILIDFGYSDSGKLSPFPFNNLTEEIRSIENLTYADGSSSNIGIRERSEHPFTSIVDGFSTGSNFGVYPDTALLDCYVTPNSGYSEFEITGLDTRKAYSIRIIGAVYVLNRVTRYTAYHVRSISETYTTRTLQVQNNYLNTVLFDHLQSYPDGHILFRVEPTAAGQSGYINALEIIEH